MYFRSQSEGGGTVQYSSSITLYLQWDAIVFMVYANFLRVSYVAF